MNWLQIDDMLAAICSWVLLFLLAGLGYLFFGFYGAGFGALFAVLIVGVWILKGER